MCFKYIYIEKSTGVTCYYLVPVHHATPLQGDEVKALVKPMLPDLMSYKVLCIVIFCIPIWLNLWISASYHVQVVPYWSRGQVSVEMKATKFMKKREANFIPISLSVKFKLFFIPDPVLPLTSPLPCQLAFIDIRCIKGASYVDIVKPCCKLVWHSLVGHGSWDVRGGMTVSKQFL